ncbi:Esterase [Nesidiocoris tenuis]|uniref:Carboxylic ester hydrolase n=1 Tax=Nesidiocoris tenuis TaxID=355587 RepID=A0ABN7BGS5_9HEMI|nr:Esterase [Nesidiocoris tenuis]
MLMNVWNMISGALVFALSDYLVPPRNGNVFVRTANGDLEGYTLTSRNGREYLAFSGIPYGEPPVGRLRFRDPIPARGWEGVRKAHQNVRCVGYQFLLPSKSFRYVEGQEDCLTLSVYTHSTNPSALKPVLVHVHGGAFELTFPPVFAWKPTYFMDYDIVVVIVSYRLSLFGFLSFENDDLPGNMGLKDQNLALRWVRDNIARFGGDPSQVTVMGESAGGVSAHYHTIMPASRGLVSKAICQSGSAYAAWALDPPGEARKRALRLAALAGCSHPSIPKMITCLQAMPANDLAQLMEKFHGFWDRDPLVTFKPVVEKPSPTAFITKLPKFWDPVTVPIIAGVASEDGLLKSSNMVLPNYDFDFVTRNIYDLLPESLMYNNSYTRDIHGLSVKIVDRYFGGPKVFSAKDEPIFAQLYSDVFFRYPLALGVEKMENDVYLYVNGFAYGKVAVITPGRTFHVLEMFHLFGVDSRVDIPLPNDANLDFSKDLVQLWTNFVIYGNPNGLSGTRWRKSPKSSDNLDFLYFTNTSSSMVSGLYADNIRFLRNSGFNELVDR